MRDCTKFYIDGAWVEPAAPRALDVIDPATEAVAGVISLGSRTDVDRAVAAAQRAFETWSRATREERMAVLARIVEVYGRRLDDMAQAISEEMGAPLATVARPQQAPSGLGHFKVALGVLKDFEFERMQGTTQIVREPVGVCGLITPWNWPANQIACKVAPALACGCTMVLKPSEIAPLSGHVMAEILHEAGVPRGVFNLVDGDGPTVGAALASHPGIDMVSFTGSTRAGILVDKAAAETVKKVSLELGGKSPNIILDGAPLQVTGDPADPQTGMGPQASEMQWRKVQALIEQGIGEGARLVCGGPGRPEGVTRGWYTRPTVFSDVTNDMTIAREEIFGPVLCILPYDTEEEAIRTANDTPYGLSAYVYGDTHEHAKAVGARMRAGNVHINGARLDVCGSFGGYKQSGLGREWGAFGFEEFLEVKSVFGAAAKDDAGLAG